MKTICECLNSSVSLTSFINESLMFEEVNTKNIISEIESTDGYDNSIKWKDVPKTIFAYKFDKSTGDLVDEAELDNEAVQKQSSFALDINPKNSDGILKYTELIRKEGSEVNQSTKLSDTNTKKDGLVIITTSSKNKDIIANYVKDNLDKFDNKRADYKLTEDDLSTLKKYFNEHVKNVEIIVKNNIFSAYFQSRDELKKGDTRIGLTNIPHMTIGKSNRLKGGIGITMYKIGRWAASEWPSSKDRFNSDGTPKYATIGDIITVLDKHFINGRWADDLGAELK